MLCLISALITAVSTSASLPFGTVVSALTAKTAVRSAASFIIRRAASTAAAELVGYAVRNCTDRQKK